MDSKRSKILIEAATAITGDAMLGKRAAFAVVRVEAADKQGNEFNTVKGLANWLLEESNKLNHMHWGVNKLSKHELLEDAYNSCRSTGDQLAEAYISLTEKPASDADTSDDAVIRELETIKARMADALGENEKFPEGLKNIFANFDEQLTTLLYKYRQFKS